MLVHRTNSTSREKSPSIFSHFLQQSENVIAKCTLKYTFIANISNIKCVNVCLIFVLNQNVLTAFEPDKSCTIVMRLMTDKGFELCNLFKREHHEQMCFSKRIKQLGRCS